MNSNARRVAVLGGIRIPFARQDGPYAQASNQDMLTATLDGLVGRFGLAGRDPRRGRRRRGAQAQPRLQPDPRVGARLQARAGDARLRRPAGVRHRARGDDPGRQQDRARPDRVRDRRRRRHHLRRAARAQRGPARACCSRSTAPSRTPGGCARWPSSARSRSCPRSPATPSRAPASRWASTPRSWPSEWGIGREEQDELAVRSHRNLAAAYDTGLPRRPGDALSSGSSATRTCAPTRASRSWPSSSPVFGGPEGTMTAGNSTPLSDGASAVLLASEEWAAEHGTARAGATHRRPDRRRRLRAQARGPADGARLRDAAGCSRAPD